MSDDDFEDPLPDNRTEAEKKAEREYWAKIIKEGQKRVAERAANKTTPTRPAKRTAKRRVKKSKRRRVQTSTGAGAGAGASSASATSEQGARERLLLHQILMQHNLNDGVDGYGFGYSQPSKIVPSPENVIHHSLLTFTQGFTDRIMRFYANGRFVNSQHDEGDYRVVQYYTSRGLSLYCRKLKKYYKKNKRLIRKLHGELTVFAQLDLHPFVKRLTFLFLFGVGIMHIIAENIKSPVEELEALLQEHAIELPKMFLYPPIAVGMGIDLTLLPKINYERWQSEFYLEKAETSETIDLTDSLKLRL